MVQLSADDSRTVQDRHGHYLSRITADKIFRKRKNFSYSKKYGMQLTKPALRRFKNDENRDKAQACRDKRERIEVKRRFSLAKRKCGTERLPQNCRKPLPM